VTISYSADTMSAGAGPSNLPPAVSELLCFISQKRNIMAVDDIAKVCSDFYREDEIMAAKALLEQVVTERLPKRQGANKCRVTIVDLIKVCQDPSASLPTYYAADLSRLPAVDINHCDVSAILAELQNLRAEVRALRHLTEDVAALREEIVQLRQLKSEIDGVRRDLTQLSNDVEQFPPLPTADSGEQMSVAVEDDGFIPARRKLFSDHATQLKVTGVSQQQPKKKHPPVVGSSSSNNRVTAVSTTRTVDIFVSRLHPMTSVAEVKECVDTIKGDDLAIDKVQCDQLKARYEHLYASFYVQLHVKSADMKRVLDLFMCEGSWPSGVLVRRYFPPKQRDG